MPRAPLPTHSGSRWEPGAAPATASYAVVPPRGAASAEPRRWRPRGPWVLGVGVVMAAVAALVSAWLWLTAPGSTLVGSVGSNGQDGANGSPVVPGQGGARHGDGHHGGRR